MSQDRYQRSSLDARHRFSKSAEPYQIAVVAVVVFRFRLALKVSLFLLREIRSKSPRSEGVLHRKRADLPCKKGVCHCGAPTSGFVHLQVDLCWEESGTGPDTNIRSAVGARNWISAVSAAKPPDDPAFRGLRSWKRNKVVRAEPGRLALPR